MSFVLAMPVLSIGCLGGTPVVRSLSGSATGTANGGARHHSRMEPDGRAAAADICRRIECDPAFGHTTSLVVVGRGAVVLERRFGPGTVDDLADTYSVTKSFVATLAGIAADRGALELDGVRDLLTMTAGRETGGAWDIDAVMERESGWVEWILSAPRRRPAGVFAYDNGAAHVLGARIADAVGQPLAAFARDSLFEPLEIDRFEWPRDPDGRSYGFGHLRLRPRDIAKLGELYLGRGSYRGRRVVSPGFVAEATRAQTPGGPPEGSAYGYLWWTAAAPFPHFFAGGYAGQSLTVVPHLDLVAVTTGDETRLRPGWRNARHAVLAALA
jgi:CubicO group peptidase (beta-lactamase class C family)